MNNIGIGKIFGMIAIFAVFAVVGYIIPIESMVGGKEEGAIAINVPQETIAASEIVETTPTEDPASIAKTEPAVAEPATTEPAFEQAPAQEEEIVEPEVNEMNVPKINSVRIGERNSHDYKKIGFNFTAKASVENKAPLKYELYEAGSKVAKYSSNNGNFSDVYPNNSGAYTLRVTNQNTGDYAERQVKGFNKLPKWSAAQLQKELTQTNASRLFFCHFDHDVLTFKCNGIDASFVPTSISELTMNISAMQWQVEVVGEIKYDEFNRITYFELNITETM